MAPSIGFGGTERVVGRLANNLIKYYNVYLILMHNSVDLPIDKRVNIIFLTQKKEHFNNTKLNKALTFCRSLKNYHKAIKSNNISICISFLARQNIINGIYKLRVPKFKTIISERCFPSNTYGKINKQLVSFFYNKNDCLFSNSAHINTDLQQNFKLKIPAYVIYNPINTLNKNPNFNSYNCTKSTFKIIAIGRLNPVKNHKNLIKSMVYLNESFHLNIYGIGILKQDLIQLTKKLKVTNMVSLKGNSNSINTEILSHHCLVLPSLSEGFPNVILEAMSLGVPVIATNCMSGPLELLNDNEDVYIKQGEFFKAKYGLLVNVNDEEALAKAITYYKNNDDVRETYSRLSFNKAKQFDITKIELQVKDLIDNVLCAE
ncbi:glycosyltransferase [Mangrovimonas cancribranchiae]|uniref:Glycosyltransferase n=1 Tax=Mangrovimonas cancribranchiae TaxID=3080055 RepID=A0AAU6NZR8_9FLAO